MLESILCTSVPVSVITADRYQLVSTIGADAHALLRVVPTTGVGPYQYHWAVTDPAGKAADGLLSALNSASVSFSPGDLDGVYQLDATVTDQCDKSFTTRVALRVGGDIGLDITTERFGVVAGGGPLGETTIHLNPQGVTPPFDIDWTVVGPDGRVDNDRLDTSDPLVPRFTSSDLAGTYSLTATVVDSTGASSVESIIVVVGQILSLDVAANRVAVLPGGGRDGMVTLLATPIGGVEPYDYEWEVIGPDSGAMTDLLWDSTVRDPVFESGDDTGTFVARCAVTDADGTVLIGSTIFVVGQEVGVDVTADRVALPADGSYSAFLVADIRGGSEPVAVEWSVTGPSGGDETRLLSGTADRETLFAPESEPGIYVVRCLVVDADGVSAIDSAILSVGGSMGASIVASKTSVTGDGVAPHGTAELSIRVYGGVPPFAYEWSVITPSGEETADSLDGIDTDRATFAGSTTIGVHTILCRVTDDLGTVAADAVEIQVGQPLNADVTVDRQTLRTGGGVSGQARLITTVNGGAAPYTFNWSVTGPTGSSGAPRLSSTSVVGPVFSSTSTSGTYSLTLTTTDAVGTVFIDSLELVVDDPPVSTPTQSFSLDVSLDKQNVAPSGGTANLSAIASGGTAPVVYAWAVTDPAGATDNGRLNSTTAANVVFTSDATQGTYRVRCTGTDANGISFTDSVQLDVSDQFFIDVSADVTHLAPSGTATLTADRSGGSANFTYIWSAVDAAGTPAGSFATGSTGTGAATQVAADDATNVWTAPVAGAGVLGTYRVTVIAADTDGNTFADSIPITVTDAFHVDLAATSVHIVPASSITLTADRTGGDPSFSYAWSSVNEASTAAGAFATGSTGTGAALQVGVDDVTNVWTAPAAGAGALGTYRITLVTTDADGVSFTETVHIVIDDPFSINLSATDTAIGPSTFTDLTADRTGGETQFSYVWTATDSAGTLAGTFTTGSTGTGAATQAAETDDASNRWTAPAGAGDTFTITVIATDATGYSFTDSVPIVVGSASGDGLTVNLTADVVFIAPGDTVTLAADQSGGTANYSYTWTAINEAGASAGTLGTASQTGMAGDATNTWVAPAAAAGILGTYRIQVVAGDASGEFYTDSLHVVVRSPLSLDVRAADIFVVPSTSISLVADQTGGETTYSYAWTATDSAGTNSGTFTTGAGGTGTASQASLAGDATNSWSVASAGTYTITCTVTDNISQVFTASTSVIVTSQDVYSLDVTTDKAVVAPGELVNLVGNRTGGTPNFTYAWSALNESGSSSGTLGSASQTGIVDDTTNTWTAPTAAGSEGTYRITCTITDAASSVFTHTVTVDVSSLALQNLFLAPATGGIAEVLATTNLTASATSADPGQQITAGLTNPPYPRNVVITMIDVNNSISSGTVRVTGIDARGLAQSEVITIAASAGGSSTNTGVAPFATVTQIDVFDFNGSTPVSDKLSVGLGDKFGLTGTLDGASDVLYVSEGGTVITTGYTVVSTVGQQGITFSASPNGTRDYIVVFRAR